MSFKKLQVIPASECVPPPTKKALTIWNLWHMFVALKGQLAPLTAYDYGYFGREFCNFMRDRELAPDAMAAWMFHLQQKKRKDGQKIGPRQINKINARIRSFLKFIADMGYLQKPLWRLLPNQPTYEPKSPQIITEEEYIRLKEYMAGRERWQVILWLCILGYRTGMSIKDCCYLRRSQVHLSDDGPCFIDVIRHKMKRTGEKALCTIPVVPGSDLHEWMVNLSKVENYKRVDGINDYVHQDAPGLYENRMCGARQDIRRVFDRVGLRGKSFRNFRNSMCSNLVNSGGQLALIMKITGHQNAKTLLGYLKVDRLALENVMLKAQQYAEQQAAAVSSVSLVPSVPTP